VSLGGAGPKSLRPESARPPRKTFWYSDRPRSDQDQLQVDAPRRVRRGRSCRVVRCDGRSTPPRQRPRIPELDELHRTLVARSRRIQAPATPSIAMSPVTPSRKGVSRASSCYRCATCCTKADSVGIGAVFPNGLGVCPSSWPMPSFSGIAERGIALRSILLAYGVRHHGMIRAQSPMGSSYVIAACCLSK
jgi:hypothetical protein